MQQDSAIITEPRDWFLTVNLFVRSLPWLSFSGNRIIPDILHKLEKYPVVVLIFWELPFTNAALNIGPAALQHRPRGAILLSLTVLLVRSSTCC
jgi:hypothetical protein